MENTKPAKHMPTSVLARQEDGTVQLTITIPQETVQAGREEALRHLTENLEIPGFRKGKAPQDVALKHIETQKLYEHMLQHLLPEVYTQAVEEHKLQPILSPRFELISIEEGKNWQVRAITCELPQINLGNYKETVRADLATEKIWVPGKNESKKEQTKEEKEQEIIKALIEKIEVKVPKLLVEEEVNHRLSHLLDQVQKLGLTVEQYLSSTGKTVEQVKTEYARQAEDSIKLELILTKIAEEEKLKAEDSEVEEIIKATGDEKLKESLSSPQQKRLIKGVLLRRKSLDTLAALV